MSRIQRALLAASLSAISLSTLTLAVPTLAAGSGTAAPNQYVVKSGDFLAGIAAKVGVKLPLLLSANNLTAKSLIMPGDKLVLPAGATAPVALVPTAPIAGSLAYRVKPGDFLLGIAAQYKVTLADLLTVNQLTVQSLIVPGRSLTMPANAVAPQPPAAGAPTTTTTTPSTTVAPAVSTLTYTIKAGDFLAGIATAYGVKLPDLLAVNKLTAASLILPGAKLAMPAGAVEPAAAPPVIQSAAGPAAAVVAYAYAQLGKPYRFFTAGPDTFDCSGLSMAAYAQIGIPLIHQSASQATAGKAVDIWGGDSIRAGDLVFLTHGGSTAITHVGIAVDATHWIDAPAPGDVVRLAPIPPKGLLAAVRRLVP